MRREEVSTPSAGPRYAEYRRSSVRRRCRRHCRRRRRARPDIDRHAFERRRAAGGRRGHRRRTPHLHDRVVQRVEVPEQVEVARDEHQRVQLLRLEGDACDGAAAVDLEEQHEERQQVRHVADPAAVGTVVPAAAWRGDRARVSKSEGNPTRLDGRYARATRGMRACVHSSHRKMFMAATAARLQKDGDVCERRRVRGENEDARELPPQWGAGASPRTPILLRMRLRELPLLHTSSILPHKTVYDDTDTGGSTHTGEELSCAYCTSPDFETAPKCVEPTPRMYLP